MVDEDQTFRFCHNSQFQGKWGEWRHSFYEHGFYAARCSRTIIFCFSEESFVLIIYLFSNAKIINLNLLLLLFIIDFKCVLHQFLDF